LQTPPTAPNVEVKKDYRDRYEEITGVSLKTCPLCRHGTMIVIETFECAASREPRLDTSRPSLGSHQHISTDLARSRERDDIAACSLISISEGNFGSSRTSLICPTPHDSRTTLLYPRMAIAVSPIPNSSPGCNAHSWGDAVPAVLSNTFLAHRRESESNAQPR